VLYYTKAQVGENRRQQDVAAADVCVARCELQTLDDKVRGQTEVAWNPNDKCKNAITEAWHLHTMLIPVLLLLFAGVDIAMSSLSLRQSVN